MQQRLENKCERMVNYLSYLRGTTDKHGNPYTFLDGKKYLINPTKNITVYGTHGHPAYTRYPHLKAQPTDASYTEWQKWFAWKPVKTMTGEKVWLRTIYRRQRTVPWTPPNFPVDALNQTQYAEWETILNLKMRN